MLIHHCLACTCTCISYFIPLFYYHHSPFLSQICLDSSTPPPNSNGTNEHLTCAITGRPCCVGIQALCVITTRENCDFLEGNFHEDAFLCSPVERDYVMYVFIFLRQTCAFYILQKSLRQASVVFCLLIQIVNKTN